MKVSHWILRSITRDKACAQVRLITVFSLAQTGLYGCFMQIREIYGASNRFNFNDKDKRKVEVLDRGLTGSSPKIVGLLGKTKQALIGALSCSRTFRTL